VVGSIAPDEKTDVCGGIDWVLGLLSRSETVLYCGTRIDVKTRGGYFWDYSLVHAWMPLRRSWVGSSTVAGIRRLASHGAVLLYLLYS
jgi:hypothetical protein